MNRVLEMVQSGDFDPQKMFTGNQDEFLEVKTAIESISNNLPKDVCIQFILTKIIPTIFDKSIDNTIRDEAVEIGLHVLQFVNVSVLSTKEQEVVFTSIEETYAKVIGELRDSNYANWDKLWIFLIKLCSEKLHTKMSVANKLLRVVEVAFRNSTSIEQRLKAYDCWIELINITSLNMEHMCSPKQIKLLMTPMKAKFSRMPVVILKRCDTFVYLLEKLGDKATLCLKEFLEFCFGPFDEKSDFEKMRQGRSVSEVCNRSTKVLLQIIGHSHDGSAECLKSDDLKLHTPLISDINFPNFAEVLIKSVIECCILLNDWSQDVPKNNTIMKCLWQSLLQLVHNNNEDVKKKCCMQISGSLRKLLEQSKYNEYLNLVLGNIADLLIQNEMIDKLKEVIFEVSMHILYHVEVTSCPFNVENIQNFALSCFNSETNLKIDRIASNTFKSSKKCKNPILCDIWLKCKVTIVPENMANFIWPLRHFQNFKDVEALKSKWIKLYTSECKTENLKATLIQEIEKLFLENPLLSSNVVVFLEKIAFVETASTKYFVARFLRLVERVLTLPNLPETDVQKISNIVLFYCNHDQHFYKTENNDEAFDKLCDCLEHLVTIHKGYTILTELTTRLKNSPPKILIKFSKRLMSFLESLMLNEDNTIANRTRKLIELLETKENEPDTVPLTSSRSLKIVSLANVSKSKKLSEHTNNSKLFGKGIDKPCPLSKKSKTFVSPRGKSRRKVSIILDEDKSSDYVKIDTEVKLNIDNLNEHQKEMLKKRREDIPAMYQDLTQSHSQDFFNKVGDSTEFVPENGASKKVEVEESALSKKRKRDDNDDFKYATKARKMINSSESNKLENKEESDDKDKSKISENSTASFVILEPKNVEQDVLEADTETLAVVDSDFTEIFGDTDVETIPKIRTEDLNNMNIFEDETTGFIQKIKESRSKTEERKTDDNTVVTKEIEAQVKDKKVAQNHKDDKNIEETEKLNNVEKKSPSDKGVRKNKRYSSKQFRDVIHNAVKKQLEESIERDKNKTPNTTLDGDESGMKNDILNDTNIDDSGEIKLKEQENMQETSLRKSKRQIKKRPSDYYMLTFEKRKRKSSKENNIRSPAVSRSSQDDFVTKHDKVKEKRESKEDTDLDNKLKKYKKIDKQKHQWKKINKKDKQDESIEILLARIDKRIEEKKKTEKKQKVDVSPKTKTKEPELSGTWDESELEDGNQNKISLSAKKLEEIEFNKDVEVKNRSSTPTKGKGKLNLSTPVSEEPSSTSIPTDEVADIKNPVSAKKSEDVYEFKGDEDPVPSEGVKKPKKKKKGMAFNRSDYISKRRRRSKKDNKEEGFPFHITADSPVPLSKSSSLRAVPSSQENETITIVITRSPFDASKDNKDSFDNSTNTTPNSPKTRLRRKISPNSEDVIESSQAAPPAETSKRRSKGKSKSKQDIDEIITIESPNDNKRRTRSSTIQDGEVNIPETEVTNTEVVEDLSSAEKNEEVVRPPKLLQIRRLSLTEPSPQIIQVGVPLKRSQSLDKLDLASEKITFTLPPDREAERVNDTSAETLTIGSVITDTEQETVASDLHQEMVITDSEEGVKTDPEEIQQADTLTLSPIKTKDDLPGSPVTCDTPDRTVELLNSTSDISPISSTPEMSTPISKHVANEVSNMRVARLLQMANSKVQISDEGRRWFGNKHASPSTSKVRKMKLKKEENFDILTFSREVPSPLTLPASGILKRKLSSLDDAATPSPKRKRVNFSDPAITEKKIFIKDTDEYNEEQNTDNTDEIPTNEMQNDQDDFNDSVVNETTKGLLSAFHKEDLVFNLNDFCDSNFKDVHHNKKDALKHLLQNLKVPEVVDVISEYLNSLDSEIVDEIQSGSSQHLFVPLLGKNINVEEFLPKLVEIMQKLPDDKLQLVASEVGKVFSERVRHDREEITEKQIEEQIVSLGCDKMSNLIKKYFSSLEGEKRNGFLVELMSLASSELPGTKEFVNCHVNILQDFVKKMTD